MSDSSSENTAVEAPAEPAPEADVKTPDPSPGEQGVETSPILERVNEALKKTAVESPATRDGEATTQPDTTSEGKAADEFAETGKYPKNAQGRIRYLLDEAKAKEAEIARLAPDAELGQKILGTLEQNGIEPEELENTLHLTSLIKSGNYDQALQALTPIYQELQKRAGELLPAELQQKVKLGHITLADAKQLHKANTALANRQAQDAQQKQRTEAQQRAAQHQATVQKAATAVTEWEKGKATADPDWQQKQGFLAKELELETRRFVEANRRFPTDKESVALAEKALKTVDASLKPFAPKPQAKIIPLGNSASPRSQVKPTSPLEALEAGLAMSKRAA
jgi:hypothetical protein